MYIVINKESFLYMKTETCNNYNKNVACKVFHRLALMIKIEHSLNMCIFFPFIDSNIVTDIDSESLFLVDSSENIHGNFSNMNSNDLYKNYVNGYSYPYKMY